MSQKLDIQNIEAPLGGGGGGAGSHVPSLNFKYGHFAFWGEHKVAVIFFLFISTDQE